jgi:FkbM family methyltransferase
MSWLARIVGRLPPKWIKAAARLQWRHPYLKWAFDRVAALIRSGEHTIQQGAGKGLRFAPGSSKAGYVLGTSEPRVQQALALLLQPGMVVFDVGAHVGFLSVIAANLVGQQGQVVCFEPLEDNCRLIERNAKLNGFSHISVRCEALGDGDGIARFVTSAVASWGRLAQISDSVANQTGEVDVAVRRLDGLVAERRIPPPHFIKIDAEGAEALLLVGARDLLASHSPVLLIELHGTNREVADILDAHGYRTIVLGSGTGIRTAPWDAHVVAFPTALETVAALVPALTDPRLSI